MLALAEEVLNRLTMVRGIDGYLDSPSRAKGTRRNYRRCWDQWLLLLDSDLINISPMLADERHVQLFIEEQRRRKGCRSRLDGDESQGEASIKGKVVTLAAAYDYLLSIGEVKSNPFARIRQEFRGRGNSADKRPTEALSPEQARTLLDYPSEHTKAGRRDRALLALLLGGGMRIAEVLNLRISQIAVSAQGTPYVRLARTKNKKSRQVPLPDWASERVTALVSQRRSEGADSPAMLFIDYRKGKQPLERKLPYRTVLWRFKRWCEELGLPEGITPHSCRATYVTKLLKDGADPEDIQAAVGHSSPAMLRMYDKRVRGIDDSEAKKIKY